MKFCLMSIIMFLAFTSCKDENVKAANISDVVEAEERNFDIRNEVSSETKIIEQHEILGDKAIEEEKEIRKERTFVAPKKIKSKQEIAKTEQGVSEEKTVKQQKKKAAIKKNKKGKLFFQKEVFDFGFIEMDEIIDHSFSFTNIGNKDVNISNATATCGCTTPVYPFIPIEPGKTSKIDVRFNSKGRLGNQIATVKIISDAEEPIQELIIKGVVRAKIVSPSQFIDTTKQ